MAENPKFRKALEAAVGPRHTQNHPLFQKWQSGELSRKCVAGYMFELWHYVSHVYPAFWLISAKAPQDVVELEIENWNEEMGEENPHPELYLRFLEACGEDRDEIMAREALPSTEGWTNWLLKLANEEPWYACFAAMHVGSEFQFAGTMGSVLQALREKYKFTEHEIEHFWVHSEADVKHGGTAMDALERHLTTKELQEAAVHYVSESARRTWFYNDCIYLHYEQGQLN